MKAFTSELYRSPSAVYEKYWLCSHAPLMWMQTASTTVTQNVFTDNLNWETNMLGSLLQFESTYDQEILTELFAVVVEDGRRL